MENIIVQLRILSHSMKNPLILSCGDKYDSEIIAIRSDGFQEETIKYVSVHSTYSHDLSIDERAHGMEIIAGKYVGLYQPFPWGPAISIRQWLDITKYTNNKVRLDAIWGSSMTIPVNISNPVNQGRSVAVDVRIHVGGLKNNGSLGCITIHPNEMYKMAPFINPEFVYEITKIG